MESKKERAHANRTRPTNFHLQPQGGIRRCGNEVGGGIPEARTLFCSTDYANGPSSATGLDLDSFDRGSVVIVWLYRSPGTYGMSTLNPVVLTAPPKDGHQEVVYTFQGSMMGTSVRYTRQPDGLWKIDIVGPDGSTVTSNYPLMLVVGLRTVSARASEAKTTEVTRMTVSNDQPISAGNLKAALDGLTGGGRS